MSGTCALSVFLRCYLRCSALHLPSLLLMLYLLLFLFTGWIWLAVCALFVASGLETVVDIAVGVGVRHGVVRVPGLLRVLLQGVAA